MSLCLFKGFSALVILAISVVVGWKPLRIARLQTEHFLLNLGEALSAGVFLGIGLFHMLPDAEKAFHLVFPDTGYPYAELIAGLGFVVLLLLEKVILQAVQHKIAKKSMVPYVLPFVLGLHALVEGAALGINVELRDALIIFGAIIAHKGSESFALATKLGKSHLPLFSAYGIFLVWALMTPLGVLLGNTVSADLQTQQGLLIAALFNAFAAGTFIYIATLHQASQVCAHKATHYWVEFLLLLAGLGLMALVEIWL